MDVADGKYVVFGDTHGRVDKIRAIYDTYGDLADGYASTGDVVDGGDLKACLDVMSRYMGALYARGNHEQYLISAMYHPDPEIRDITISHFWRRVHDGVLQAYNIYPSIPTQSTADRLREKMDQVGHLAYLAGSNGFIEGPDWVVVHGNVTAEPWERQRQELTDFTERWIFESDSRIMPYQMGEGVSHVQEGNLLASGLTKTLLSGHFHRRTRDLNERQHNNGQQLLLATWPNDDFVVVYETWTKQMKVIEVAGT